MQALEKNLDCHSKPLNDRENSGSLSSSGEDEPISCAQRCTPDNNVTSVPELDRSTSGVEIKEQQAMSGNLVGELSLKEIVRIMRAHSSENLKRKDELLEVDSNSNSDSSLEAIETDEEDDNKAVFEAPVSCFVKRTRIIYTSGKERDIPSVKSPRKKKRKKDKNCNR